jgi:hypothetical protein
MFKITIPKPCHANWSEMTPTQQGAFCGSCNKEVIDFTKMTDEEIQNYFLHKNQNKTCGHFRKEQIHRICISLPDSIFTKRLSNWKKFMAVLLLAFGSMLFGCDVRVQDKKLSIVNVSKTESKQTSADTTFEKGEPYLAQLLDVPPLLGTVAFIIPDSSTCKKQQADNSSTIDGKIELVQIGTIEDKTSVTDSTDYDKVFTGGILLEKSDKIIDTLDKKLTSDTGKCKDPGYY